MMVYEKPQLVNYQPPYQIAHGDSFNECGDNLVDGGDPGECEFIVLPIG